VALIGWTILVVVHVVVGFLAWLLGEVNGSEPAVLSAVFGSSA